MDSSFDRHKIAGIIIFVISVVLIINVGIAIIFPHLKDLSNQAILNEIILAALALLFARTEFHKSDIRRLKSEIKRNAQLTAERQAEIWNLAKELDNKNNIVIEGINAILSEKESKK